MKLIAVAGQAQNGKDTISDYVMKKLTENGQSWKRTAFANKVKEIFCETFGKDLEFAEKWKVIQEIPEGFDMSIRQALQFIGDGFRKIKPTVWLDQPFRDKSTPIIISDVRYINEFSRVFSEGGLNIIVVKPDKINYDNNFSESQIRPYSEWFFNFFKNDPRIVINLKEINWNLIKKEQETPEKIELFHVFINNFGTKKELENSIEDVLIPIVLNFKF
jgi:hypothetical protein